MELIIKIKSEGKYDRRRLNNLLANSTEEIHHFILKSNANDLVTPQSMGNELYELEIIIDE